MLKIDFRPDICAVFAPSGLTTDCTSWRCFLLPQPIIQKFRESLRGRSFCPDEPGYDDARTIPNAMINRRPAVIARCASAADVIACVRFAREHDMLVAVRG